MNVHKENLRLQILCNKITRELDLPHIKVKLSEENSNECYGLYFYENHWIKIYSRVAQKQLTQEKLREVMCHEVAHYYQYVNYDNLKHNEQYWLTYNDIISRFY